MEISKEEILKLFEGQTIEFKKSLGLIKEASEALCGMLNSDISKGVVLFGISPDGSITGVEQGNLDSAQRTITQHIRQKFEPSLICTIEIFECENKKLVKLEAKREPAIAYHEYDGRAYIREGSTTRQLSYQEKQNLLKKRDRSQHNGPWRCDKCGQLVGQLYSYKITDTGMEKTFECGCGGEFWPIT
ncbi:MAG: AlbA family DNA-binding domain-containing protein [Dehalococcoidales bacterium]